MKGKNTVFSCFYHATVFHVARMDYLKHQTRAHSQTSESQSGNGVWAFCRATVKALRTMRLGIVINQLGDSDCAESSLPVCFISRGRGSVRGSTWPTSINTRGRGSPRRYQESPLPNLWSLPSFSPNFWAPFPRNYLPPVLSSICPPFLMSTALALPLSLFPSPPWPPLIQIPWLRTSSIITGNSHSLPPLTLGLLIISKWVHEMYKCGVSSRMYISCLGLQSGSDFT